MTDESKLKLVRKYGTSQSTFATVHLEIEMDVIKCSILLPLKPMKELQEILRDKMQF